MNARPVFILGVVLVSGLFAGAMWGDVPAPPANQTLGMPDVLVGELTENDCRVCHASALVDRHHVLYGQSTPDGSQVPYPDADGDGVPDAVYGCLNCHDSSFTPERDCTVCHTSNAHHRTPAAKNHDCVSCHGNIVNNMNDGHYVPSYPISDVTPAVNHGDGLPLNNRGNGAGACNYCHDDDGLPTPIIEDNGDLHHATTYALDGALDCLVCHEILDPLSIRTCERCHGPDSLHNIQADSPNPSNLGMIVVGGEDPGYGHVGRDFAPGDSDCWGCHGFSVASAPNSGPIVPTVYSLDSAAIRAGANTAVSVFGASLINLAGGEVYQSKIELTAADGSTTTLIPDLILDEGTLVVTIPGSTAPGNYGVRAIKGESISNPTALSVLPRVTISTVSIDGLIATINGNGFGGFAPGSGMKVMAVAVNGRTGKLVTIEGIVKSWTDTKIVASFRYPPKSLTVTSVFGTAVRRLAR